MSEELEYRVRVVQDSTTSSPDEYGDDGLLLVNYHRDFHVTRDEIITKEQVKAHYRGEDCDGLKELKQKYYFFQLSCLVHSGVWLSLDYSFTCDPCGWDTSHVGLVLVAKSEAKTLKDARRLAESLICTWNMSLSGDVWGYVIEWKEECPKCRHIEWHCEDSLWGIYGAENVEDAIPDKYRHLLPDQNEWELGG